jgi:hypothetical protein
VSARLRLLAVVFALGGAQASCAGKATPQATRAGAPPSPPRVAADAIDGSPVVEAPNVEALAALASKEAPGMREVARGESPLPASIKLPSGETDVCLRAAFAASSPVVAALVDRDGDVLDLSLAGEETLLDTGGPVCLRKNHAAHLEVQGPLGPVRYVVWMTP